MTYAISLVSQTSRIVLQAYAFLVLGLAFASEGQSGGFDSLDSQYGVAEIQFRFDSRRPFEVPAVVDLAHDAPIFGDGREIFLRFNYWNGVDRAGIMSWNDQAGLSTATFKDSLFPSSIRYSDKESKLYFELVNYGYFGEGIFSLDSNLQSLESVYQGSEDLFASDIGRLESKSMIAFRARKKAGGQSLSSVILGQDRRNDFLKTVDLDKGSELSWIFAPRFSSDGKFVVVKVRLGKPGEISESQPDEIRIYSLNAEGTAVLISSIKDRDADGSSSFVSFDNVAEINSKGHVVFGARNNEGRRGYYLLSENRLIRIVQEGEGGVLELPHFYPDINGSADVVFRVRTKSGENVMLYSQGKLMNLMRAGDRLKSDLGDVLAGDADSKRQSFFNSPQINSRGDVLVGVLVRDPETQVNVGLGFYVIPKNTVEN